MDSRKISEQLIETYFKTFEYPFTHHQINSYDQFISSDIPAIIKSYNPIIMLQDFIGTDKEEGDIYTYTTNIYIGGLNGDRFYIGTPTINLKEDTRVLFPNEARLRNLTYASNIQVDIVIKITFASIDPSKGRPIKRTIILDPTDKRYEYLGKVNLFKIPLMLHSRYCLLHNKPNLFLREVGECAYDYGGYFVVDGSEKVLITRQEQAFNTLYITKQEKNPIVEIYASIQCLNEKTKQVKRIAFSLDRRNNVLYVSIPFIRKPIPAFILFRALGVQSDNDILRLIFPDENDIETKTLEPYLHETLLESDPFMDQYSAIQYMKLLTKGFSEAHVYDILYNQVFIHVENKSLNKAYFLADSIRKILRVKANIDKETDRDDIRNQRCLTSGFLAKMLFQNIYKNYVKVMTLSIDREFKNNVSNYTGENFLNLFLAGNVSTLFQLNYITEGINKGFKGKWKTGPGAGDDQTGALQPLSRLSYLDFLSHCRRVNLNFDTSMKLQGPRRLHTTQFGYFCTSETPGGASIGITKNLSNFTAISLGMEPQSFIDWLVNKMNVVVINDLTPKMMKVGVPIYVNAAIIGYTFENPFDLVKVCKLLKHTGCLPCYSSIVFNIRDRVISFYFDQGRPLRPLIHVENGKYPTETIQKVRNWTALVKGTYPKTKQYEITNSTFIDPLSEKDNVTVKDYMKELQPHAGVIEYVDPYEANEAYIAMYPEQLRRESTHVEIHPSTIVGLLTSMIPFPNHNQSPRNQLSCSQSKQGVSIFSTAYKNRFDNQTHVLCYGEAPLVRTLYYDYVADGQIGYGHNLTLAMGCFTGYNQEDGIVMNADSFQRGMFRNITYRSYEVFEEDDAKANNKTRIANPANVPNWTQLKPGIDYGKLDERGIVKKGEFVDENTVLVGRYLQSANGDMHDASVTAQVWTSGIVDDVVVTLNNMGLALVKIRVIQDRIPELGDKFCLTDDHDVLTKNRGWVSIKDITINDEVAQLNKENDTMEYVKPKETFVFDHKGDMYEVESQGVSLKTTLNHRMWIQGRYDKTYGLVEASNIIGKRVRYQSDAPINNTETDIIINNYTFNKGKEANAWLELFGIWIAEGWTYIKENEYINRIEFAANKLRVQEKLKECCNILNWNYSFNEKSFKFYINEKEMAQYLEKYSVGAINKYLPNWVFNLSVEQTKILINALCMGDGHETKTSLQYFTSSKKLKDDIQQLVQHAGWTSYSVVRYEEGWVSPILNKNGKEFKANSDAWVIGIRKSRLRPTINHGHVNTQNGQKEIVEHFEGKVYCISVPSEVFLVRRNGRIVFTGNSNRHGQKGTIGMLVRACDMPRTASGLVPDMIMNPHAIPSRMTIAQLLESLLGKVACNGGFIGDATAFMNEENTEEVLGRGLEKYGLNKYGEELMYDGTTGTLIPATMFVGNVYTMRLKHMVEDKWNARGEGRREQRTHQPTGGRGNQGGLRIGEMERDAIVGHGISAFVRESYMKRADGATITICNGCGTIPIINVKDNFQICPMCDGPLQFIGETATNLELLPTMKRSLASFSKIEIPYSFELFNKEMNTYMNMYVRYLTTKDITQLRRTKFMGLKSEEVKELLNAELPTRVLRDLSEPEVVVSEPEPEITPEQEEDLGVVPNVEVDEELPELEVKTASTEASQPEQSTRTVLVSQPPVMVAQPPIAVSLPAIQTNEMAQNGGANNLTPQMTTTMNQPYVLMPLQSSIAPMAVIQSAIPNAPPTLVVDTSEEAMEAEGFTKEIQPLPNRSSMRRSSSPPRSRPSRSVSFGSINKLDSDTPSTPFTSKSVVNIVKEGQ